FRTNAFLSIYGTDFKFPVKSQNYSGYLYAEPVIYDNECSCEMSSNCTTQAAFIETNSSRVISIIGMKMGCTPSDSFLASTLECFYNRSCLDVIQQYTNYPYSLTPLLTTNLSRFSQNTTITEFIKHLFIEKWSTKIDYQSYYEQCSPLLCSHTSVENFDIIYSITVILGIQGGLKIVLNWLCPKLVRIALKIHHSRKKRIASIHPDDSFAISSQISTNRIIQNTALIRTTKPMNLTSQNNLIARGIVMFSIYYARQESICQPEFERTFIDILCFSETPKAIIAVDVNIDGEFDIIFYCPDKQTLHILFGTGNNSTFSESNIYSFHNNASVSHILSGDVNNDDQIDLILVYNISNDDHYLGVLLGNSNGTFQIESMQSIAITGVPKNTLFVDLNNDKLFDIISVNTDNNLQVIFGNESGTFSSPLTLHKGYYIESKDLVIADFNNDSYMDIAVFDQRDLHIHVFFANAKRSLWSHKWLFTAIRINRGTLVSGDFDGNNQTDIVFLAMYYESFTKLYRYNSSTFRTNEHIHTTMEKGTIIELAVVGDLNGDRYLDIVIMTEGENDIYSFLGTGSEKFEIQQTTDYVTRALRAWIDIIDINHDGCPDIIALVGFSYARDPILEILLNTCACYTREIITIRKNSTVDQ
ncbi:unnamed protein product, partial [Adineta ricciae]